jgi:hypothetical protein
MKKKKGQLEDMAFNVPPVCQGQMVEVAYSCQAGYIVKRIHDMASRDTRYEVAEIYDNDWEWYETYHPVNGEPPSRLDWMDAAAYEFQAEPSAPSWEDPDPAWLRTSPVVEERPPRLTWAGRHRR